MYLNIILLCCEVGCRFVTQREFWRGYSRSMFLGVLGNDENMYVDIAVPELRAHDAAEVLRIGWLYYWFIDSSSGSQKYLSEYEASPFC